EGKGTTLEEGGRGAGIHPIWMSFFTDFVTAEAALTTTGVTADARAALESGVTKSITRVMNFPTQAGAPVCAARTPSSTTITNYIAKVMSLYDAAATNSGKLDVVLKEFYLALWGNGLEAYNMYRRSSRPKNLQPTFQPNPGQFIRSFLYPSNHVNLNSNAVQKPNMAVKVFWDTNPDPLF
ncbi:MAG: SusD/RagB family nutrient-binding outer membrane lipoprotein, partial [Ginsengibacter sp.]